MSEALSINSTMPIEAQQHLSTFNQIRNTAALRLSGAILTGTVVLTGCTGSAAPEASTPSEPTSSEQETRENTCGKIDFAQNYANTNFGVPTAVFPNLYTQEGSERKLFAAEQASETLKRTVANDYRALAYVKAVFIDTRSAVTPADLSANNIATNAQNLIKGYEDKSRDIIDDVTDVCNALAPAFLTSNDSFRVAQNLTSQVNFERADGKVTKTGFVPASAPGTLRGFQINPNYDDGGNADRRASLEELASSMMITEDGKIVIKLTTGPLMFDINKNSDPTPVDIKVEADQQIVVSPSNQPGEAPAGSKKDVTSKDQPNNAPEAGQNDSGTNGGDAPTGSNGGTETGNNGCGTPGAVECGGGSGTDIGNEGTGDGDNGDGGETPAPAPTPAPTKAPTPAPQPTQKPTPAPKPQPTQPAPQPTQPPATQPPTQEPSPEPTGDKGEKPPVDCDPEFTPEGCN